MSNAFRLRGTHFLITWAQLDIDHVTIFNLLDSYAPVAGAVLARELHADGQPHFHAYVEFADRLDRRLTDQLDALGKHPNVRPKRYPKERHDAAEYCRKGDQWIEYGTCETQDQETPSSTLLDLIEGCDSFGDVLNLSFSAPIPYQLAKAAWNYLGATTPRTWLPGETYGGQISSRDLLDLNWVDDEPPTSLIICGQSGLGKSSWAIANMPRPALVIRHLEDILHFRREFHNSLIFDDVSLTHLPRTTQLQIVDREQNCSIHVRHVVARIPEFVPRVFTCNPGYLPVDLADPAIARRCTLFECE